MATVLDVGLLNFFLPVFTFLFITILCYAILRKVLKDLDNKAVWVAAICLGLMALFSGKAIDLINFITPWYIVIFVFLLLTFMALMFWDVPQKDILASLGGTTTIVVIGILILVLGISQVFSPVFSPYSTTDSATKTIAGEALKTVFHPRILGAIFILIIAAFAVQRISEVEMK
jgi:hypothetical protein